MATNLSEDFIRRLLAGDNSFDPLFSNIYDSYSYLSPESGGGGQPVGTGPVRGFERTTHDGRNFSADQYDLQGNYTGTRQWKDGTWAGDLAKGLGFLAGSYFGIDNLLGPGGLLTSGAEVGLGNAASGAAGMTPAEQAAFLEANMGAGAPGAGFGGVAGAGGSAAGTLAGNLGGVPAVPGAVADIAATGPLAGPLTASQIGGAAAGASMIPNALKVGSGLLSNLPAWAQTAAQVGLPLLGAAAGAQGNPATQQTNERKLDPRIDSLVFGQGGLLSDVGNWYSQNKSGTNPAMQAASEQLTGLLTNPLLMQQIREQGGIGMGLMRQPIARNPFGG